MKKLLVWLLLCALMLSGCGGNSTPAEEVSTQTLTAPTQILEVPTQMSEVPTEETTVPPETFCQGLSAQLGPWDWERDFRISLPQLGLQDVRVVCAYGSEELDTDVFCRTFLVTDDAHKHSAVWYLLLVTQDQIYAFDCGLAMDATLEVRDFDGDGYCELLLQQMMDLFGGAGQYASRVLEFKNGNFETIFTSLLDGHMMDTGFALHPLEKETYEVVNSVADYRETFTLLKEDSESFVHYMYDDKGTPQTDQLWVDSFCDFTSVDIENDGIYEIHATQYSCVSFHNNYFGECHTVWKYNANTENFEIYDAWFEPKD